MKREDLERYVLSKIRAEFPGFPKEITLETTFEELGRSPDLDLGPCGLFLDIERDLGMRLTDEELLPLEHQDVGALVDALEKHQRRQDIAASQDRG